MGKVTIPINLSDPVVLQRFQHHLAQRWLQEHAVEGGSGKTYKPRMELYEDADSKYMTARLELPGVKPEGIEVHFNDGNLVIFGKNPPHASLGPNPKYMVQEIKRGDFKRKIELPDDIRAEQIFANASDGILTILWPKEPSKVAGNQ